MVEWNSGMTILNINKQFQGVGNREGGGGGKTRPSIGHNIQALH